MVIADLLKSWGLAGSTRISKGAVQANKNTSIWILNFGIKARDTISGKPTRHLRHKEGNSSFSLHQRNVIEQLTIEQCVRMKLTIEQCEDEINYSAV